jgi:predicted nucleic acid-binding protein
MAKPVYFDTSIFIEMATRGSKYKKQLRELLQDLQERKVRIYTSIVTVQEMSVASHRKGGIPKDTVGDIRTIARIYTITKEIALAAAKREAELKDLAEEAESKRDASKPLTQAQEIDRICENRRRKWDCFHIATAQILECTVMYCTDTKMQKRPRQLNLKPLQIEPPPLALRKVTGPLIDAAKKEK